MSGSKRDPGDPRNDLKVTVAIRIRPFIHLEKLDKNENVLARRGKIYCARVGKGLHGEKKNLVSTFQNFDHVYGGETGQYEIYQDIGKEVIRACVDHKVNSTVFAYGQTGSGKTYSMLGNLYDSGKIVSLFDTYSHLFHIFPVELVNIINSYIPRGEFVFSQIGLIPRICKSLFDELNKKNLCPHSGRKLFEVKVRFVEVYNGKTRDLLTGKRERFLKNQVKATKNMVRVKNAKKKIVESYEETIGYLRRGLRFRVTKSTKGNRVSSRSHAVFTVFVRTFSPINNRIYTERKINLVDLAGSEKYRKKKYSQARQKEGLYINMSLLELGRSLGIAAHNAGKANDFVPVRGNVLTLLLKDSLGGVSKTFMIANCSPCKKDVNESFCTLNYAHRCKKIRLRLKKAERGDWAKKLVSNMKYRCKLSKQRFHILRKFDALRRRVRFERKRMNKKDLTLRESMFWGQYNRNQNSIHNQNSKIIRFLNKKLDKFDREVVNDAVLVGLEGCALEFDEIEIAGVIKAIEKRFDRSVWDYGDYHQLL